MRHLTRDEARRAARVLGVPGASRLRADDLRAAVKAEAEKGRAIPVPPTAEEAWRIRARLARHPEVAADLLSAAPEGVEEDDPDMRHLAAIVAVHLAAERRRQAADAVRQARDYLARARKGEGSFLRAEAKVAEALRLLPPGARAREDLLLEVEAAHAAATFRCTLGVALGGR